MAKNPAQMVTSAKNERQHAAGAEGDFGVLLCVCHTPGRGYAPIIYSVLRGPEGPLFHGCSDGSSTVQNRSFSFVLIFGRLLFPRCFSLHSLCPGLLGRSCQ